MAIKTSIQLGPDPRLEALNNAFSSLGSGVASGIKEKIEERKRDELIENFANAIEQAPPGSPFSNVPVTEETKEMMKFFADPKNAGSGGFGTFLKFFQTQAAKSKDRSVKVFDENTQSTNDIPVSEEVFQHITQTNELPKDMQQRGLRLFGKDDGKAGGKPSERERLVEQFIRGEQQRDLERGVEGDVNLDDKTKASVAQYLENENQLRKNLIGKLGGDFTEDALGRIQILGKDQAVTRAYDAASAALRRGVLLGLPVPEAEKIAFDMDVHLRDNVFSGDGAQLPGGNANQGAELEPTDIEAQLRGGKTIQIDVGTGSPRSLSWDDIQRDMDISGISDPKEYIKELKKLGTVTVQ